ncbi:hypothetical protein SR870_13970 [Rhodopseudomonas palustris]|uniref:Uncharacterized protein n=1 Tax=Rhodopseudomonas palustris (strain HaA2) TaxID=316058 RepID=Q2IVJ1_RHOP2|nr:hypothetical protein [Rhodopseudomonas palustris]ABD07769.1 hypothetical protein RPB_3068 [Rhodopseudomonas palustris HaA2]WQG97820.1 hypothetical protein SR870_13970 [Rhodopseudomonas palustris]
MPAKLILLAFVALLSLVPAVSGIAAGLKSTPQQGGVGTPQSNVVPEPPIIHMGTKFSAPSQNSNSIGAHPSPNNQQQLQLDLQQTTSQPMQNFGIK